MKTFLLLLLAILFSVCFADAQNCLPPSNLTLNNATASSLEYTWINNNAAADSLWDMEVSLCGLTPSGIPTVSSTITNPISFNPYHLVGLSSATSMRVYVRSYCTSTNSYSPWITSDTCFSTLTVPSCQPPTNISISNISSDTADIAWIDNNTPPSLSWDLEVGIQNFIPTGIPTHTMVTNPYTLSGLAPNTTYCAYVRSRCPSVGFSVWSTNPTCFTTQYPTNTVNYNNISKQFTIYPNPTSNSFNIKSNYSEKIKQITIVDISGKAIKSFDANTKNINTFKVNGIEPGVYYCKFILEKQQRVIKKVVVQ